jgi:hypothetical protein
MKVEEIAEAVAKLPPEQTRPLPRVVQRVRSGPHSGPCRVYTVQDFVDHGLEIISLPPRPRLHVVKPIDPSEEVPF